jgi:putative peptidoglycan lipid II flippase
VSKMHRRILTDTARIGALTACVKVSGALKTVIIARSFGAGDTVDAYLMAFLIPSFAGDVLAGAIAPALLPILVQVKEREGVAAARELSARVLGATTALLLVVALAAAALSRPAVQAFASGFGPEKLHLTRTLLYCMLPILPLTAVTATFRTILNAEDYFAVPALAPVMTPLATVAAIWAFGRAWDARALVIGTVGGSLLEVLLLSVALWRLGLFIVPRLRGTSTALRRVFSEFRPVAASNLILSGSSIIDQSLAATLGSGSVSALNYGTRLVTVILSIGSSSLGTAILPRFSKLAASGQWRELRNAFRSLAWLSLGVTIPLTAVLVSFSEPLARILFERGAFTSSTTHLVGGSVQALSLLQIPFSVLMVLVVRIVSSLKANRLLFYLAILSLVATFVFDVLLMRWMGVAGIALSSTLVRAAGLAFLLLALFRTRPWTVLNQSQNGVLAPASLVTGGL